MGKFEVVKVQAPLASSEAADECLIYDSRRARKTFVELDQLPVAVRTAIKRNALRKVYVHAQWTGRSWSLGEVADDQAW